MASTQIYGRYSDNVASTATLTVQSGTEDTDYPLTNLVTLNPAKPGKLTTTSGRIVFAFGSAQSLDVMALIHPNLDAGLTVTIQAHTSSDFTSPSLSQSLTIPALPADSYPINPWADLTGNAARSYQYWAVYISGTNTAEISIGEIVLLATKRTLPRNLQLGFSVTEQRPTVEHVTDYGVSTVYSLGPRMRTWRGLVNTDGTGMADLLALERDTQHRRYPFLWVPDPDVNDAALVRLGGPEFSETYRFPILRQVDVRLEEVSRGLRP